MLVTGTGLLVKSESGPIQVPPATAVSIGGDGTISLVPLGLSAAASSQVDRIKLVNPPQKDLTKGADGLLHLKSGAAAPTDENVVISSGSLESSNVNAAMSLVNMIELQRQYEFQIKSMNSTDTNEQSAERMMLTS
jgi:flagellar basal-body rod protein FlgF